MMQPSSCSFGMPHSPVFIGRLQQRNEAEETFCSQKEEEVEEETHRRVERLESTLCLM